MVLLRNILLFNIIINRFYCVTDDIQYNIHMASKKHVKVMKKRKRKHNDTTLNCVCDNDNKCNSHKKS